MTTRVAPPRRASSRRLAFAAALCCSACLVASTAIAQPPAKAFPLPAADRLERAGLKVVRGERVVIVSDSKEAPLDELVASFDAAYLQWLAYFAIDDPTPRPPPTTVFLVVEPARFQSVGLWDERLPAFKFGYAFSDRVWVYDQPISPYFRRHLLLHEGVHAVMFSRFGSCGPTWYMEGTAELLATHRMSDGKPTLPYFPKAVEEVPALGRLNTVREATDRGEGLTARDVLALRPSLEGDNVLYGWCWAFAEYLDGHPRWRERFRALGEHAANPEFMALFLRDYRDDWSELAEEWLLFTHGLEFDYDFERAAVVRRPAAPLKPAGDAVTIAADRGWQSTGVVLEKGVAYTLVASGRFQVADEYEGRAAKLEAEPNGISIRYYDGRPLGLLLGAVRPDRIAESTTPLLAPLEIGLGTTVTPDETGVLYLRVNDSAAELADNRGEVAVKISRKK